jgi:hypothetical protein
MHSARPKVFCIGFQKTGTVSFKLAVRVLGYRVCGYRLDLIDAVRAKDFGPVGALVDRFDAFRDNPWPLLFRELDAHYPGSKFVLTTRDEKSWIKSMVNHLGVLPDPMQQLIYGVGAPGGYEDVVLQRYRRHNEEVRAHFAGRPDDLLIADWEKGDGWRELCGFLGHDVPMDEFPHGNRRRYDTVASRVKFAAARAIRLGRQLAGR